MGAIEDLGLHYRPLARAVPEQVAADPGKPSDAIVDELIDQESAAWGRIEEDRRSSEELVPTLKQMLGPSISDEKINQKVTSRLAEYMISNGVDPRNETAVKHMIVSLAQKAEPLGLGRVHPVLRAYAYTQAIKNGGAYR